MVTTIATWERLASSDRLQRSSQTVSVVKDRVWIFGGEVEARQPVDNQADIIQLSATPAAVTTISPPGDAPSPRVGSASAVLDNMVYIFSGRGGTAMAPIEENGTLWKFDIATLSWDSISPADSTAPYPEARSYHAMTNDGKNVYIHAGCPASGRLSDLWAFDVAMKTWTSLAAAPGPPRGGTSVAYCDGKLYRMNGFDGVKEQGGKLDVYDPAGNVWSTITFPADGVHGPAARSVCTLLAVRIKGRHALLTGFGEHDPSLLGHAGAGKMLGDVWVFDLEAGNWSRLETKGDTPEPRGWFDADVLQGADGKDSVLVHGGLSEDNIRLGDVWRLKLE